MLIKEIVEWNETRENMEFDGQLAFTMLTEELDEFAWALPKVITDKFGELSEEERTEEKLAEIGEWMASEECQVNFKVAQLDALGDLVFVAIGEMGKILGDASKVEDVMGAILAANNLKGKDKESGKITKPEGFVGPESIIAKVVQDEG